MVSIYKITRQKENAIKLKKALPRKRVRCTRGRDKNERIKYKYNLGAETTTAPSGLEGPLPLLCALALSQAPRGAVRKCRPVIIRGSHEATSFVFFQEAKKIVKPLLHMAALAPMAALPLSGRTNGGARAMSSRSIAQRLPTSSLRAKARKATVGVNAAANGAAGSIREQAGRRGE